MPASMQRILLLTCVLLITLTAAGTALACDCLTPSRSESFERADLVFEGLVTRVDQSAGDTAYTFHVQNLRKGQQVNQVTIFGGKSNCNAEFRIGLIYRVYARHGERGFFSSMCFGNETIGAIHYNRKFYSVSSTPFWQRQYVRVLSAVGVALLATAIFWLLRRKQSF